jgi:cytochrome c-type biogenesis protein CcmF
MPEIKPFSSPLLGFLVTAGNLAIWVGLACAVTCVALYWRAMLGAMPERAGGVIYKVLGMALAAAAAGLVLCFTLNVTVWAKLPVLLLLAGLTVFTVLRLSGKVPPRTSEAEPESEAASAPRGKKGRRAPATAAAPPDGGLALARRFFYATCACVVVGSLCLWSLIFQQEYVIRYVWKNSYDALNVGYRFASFWADQEGTFFLWGLYNTILGGLLIRKAREDERWVMPFFALVNVSLFTLLTFMNPFWMIPANEIREQLSASAPPEVLKFLPTTFWGHVSYYFGWAQYWPISDGKGLNESLQNFWMVIHPPTLFVGYSSMIVPGCFALAALMRRDYDGWVTRAMPWLAFSWAVLATGIFLGAYWAYETLGWGGYWSWDPVENSSIVPWVVATALFHGLLAQKARGNYKQANLFLGIMTAATVLLGSFLVRSGVLSDTSVHSFATPQRSVFITLMAVMVIFTALAVAIWTWRFREIQAEIAYDNLWERHFGFFLGLIVLSASALVILFGVFFVPVLLPLFMARKIEIPYYFYNQALIPVMYVTVVLMALTPLMPWRQVKERPLKLFDKLILGLTVGVTLFFLMGAVVAWRGGFRIHDAGGEPFLKAPNDFAYLAFMLMIGVAILTTVVCLNRARRGGWLNIGPWVAHAGFLVMLIGVVYTSRFNTTTPVSGLAIGESATVGDREFTFRGQRLAANSLDRDRMLIDVVENGKTTRFDPKIFLSTITGEAMAWPQIVSRGIDDLYISPNGVQHAPLDAVDGVGKQQTVALNISSNPHGPPVKAQLVFNGLDMSELQRAMQNNQKTPPVIWADISVLLDGKRHEVRPGLRLIMAGGDLKKEAIPAEIPGLEKPVSVVFADTNFRPEQLTVNLATAVQQGSFQVLYVPGIQILWWGCYLLIAGGAITYRRRVVLARRPVPEAAAAPVAKPGRVTAPEPAGAE